MSFRFATISDLPVLMEVYQRARHFMRLSGNPNQWPNGKPSREELIEDINNKQLYVLELDGEIQASFVYYEDDDPCYKVIYDGYWLNKEPYAVLHRVATRGLKKHMGQQILEFAFQKNENVRIDTHEDNKPMQNLLTRNGFVHVGTIILANGEPRLAYHWTKDCNLK